MLRPVHGSGEPDEPAGHRQPGRRRLLSARDCGFTLIELLAVIAILAILAVFAAPRFFDNQAFRERGYADEVAAALRHARKVAVASGCDARFTLDAAGAYQVRQRGAAGTHCNTVAAAWPTVVTRGDGTQVTGQPPPGVAAAPVVTIVFGPQGNIVSAVPAPGGPLTVGAFSVTIDPPSGWVMVQ